MIDGLDEAVATALGETHVFEEHLLLFIRLQFGNVSLCLCADDKHFGLLTLDGLGHVEQVGKRSCNDKFDISGYASALGDYCLGELYALGNGGVHFPVPSNDFLSHIMTNKY